MLRRKLECSTLVFISTELLNFVVRLLWVRIPDGCIGTSNQPWNAAHFNSLMVLKHILTLPHYTQTNRRQIMENNTVEALLDFFDADFDLLGLYPAVYQGRNEVYGIRDKRPAKGWDQGS